MNDKNKRGAGFSCVGTFWLIALITLLAIFSVRPARADNNTPYVNGGTNTVLVGVSNSIVSVVQPLTTNYFNLSTSTANQANTNFWPACNFQIQDNMYNPSRWVTFMDQFQCGAANTGNLTVRVAGSLNGTIWQTNPCPLIMTIPANGTGYAQYYTNFDSAGWQYMAIYSIENTNASVFCTNNWVGTGFDRGL